VLHGGGRLNDSGEALPRALVTTCHACLKLDPAERPSIATILEDKVLRHRAGQLGISLPGPH